MLLDTVCRQQLDALMVSVRSRYIGLKSIGDATGVHTSQVSRILAGKVKRVSPNVEKICKFAKVVQLQQGTRGSEELLWKAVKDVWDGTNEHAMALANLLRAIDCYQAATQKTSNNLPFGT